MDLKYLALHSVRVIVATTYMTTLAKTTKKKTTGYKESMITMTKINSTINGTIWKSAILKIVEKLWEPRETVLITLPVSLDK
jgi:hypothetical protein